MKKEFKDLVDKNLDADYAAYLGDLHFNNPALQTAAINLANMSLQADRNKQWQAIKQIPNFAMGTDSGKLANPYYVGFGNPDADVLFVGKEKAFNLIDSPVTGNPNRNYIDLLFHESINNRFDFKTIIGGKFSQKHDFCPIYPLLANYYYRKYPKLQTQTFSAGHTWKHYEYLLAGINPPIVPYEADRFEYRNSLFEKCFMTELNFVPKTSNGDFDWEAFNTYRRPFLVNDFYRSFPIVIVNAKAHLGLKEQSVIEDIFNVRALLSPTLQVGLASITNRANYVVFNNAKTGLDEIALCPQHKSRKFPVSIYKSADNKRFVFSVWHLSGGNGWSFDARDRLAALINARTSF